MIVVIVRSEHGPNPQPGELEVDPSPRRTELRAADEDLLTGHDLVGGERVDARPKGDEVDDYAGPSPGGGGRLDPQHRLVRAALREELIDLAGYRADDAPVSPVREVRRLDGQARLAEAEGDTAAGVAEAQPGDCDLAAHLDSPRQRHLESRRIRIGAGAGGEQGRAESGGEGHGRGRPASRGGGRRGSSRGELGARLLVERGEPARRVDEDLPQRSRLLTQGRGHRPRVGLPGELGEPASVGRAGQRLRQSREVGRRRLEPQVGGPHIGQAARPLDGLPQLDRQVGRRASGSSTREHGGKRTI